MTKLIDKDALVAEIKRRKSELQSRIAELGTFESNTLDLFQEMELYDDIISFLNTLEVKEVDLEKEATRFVQTKEFAECEGSPVLCVAKHFFELGLKARQG